MYKTKTPDDIDAYSLSDIAAIATNAEGLPLCSIKITCTINADGYSGFRHVK